MIIKLLKNKTMITTMLLSTSASGSLLRQLFGVCSLACSGCKVIVLDDQDDDEEEEHDDDENHNDDDKHNYKKWSGYDQAVIHVMITAQE